MESTILVDIDDDSRLMFGTNSSGMVLISQFGNIGFSAEEFQYYQCLFKMTDTENIGKLRIGSSSLSSLLWRTSLDHDTIHKMLLLSVNAICPKARYRTITTAINAKNTLNDEVENTVDEKSEDMFNEHKDDWVADMQDDIVVTDKLNTVDDGESYGTFLSLHQWLLLCKMILHLQLNPQTVADVTLLEIICSMYEYENQNGKIEGLSPITTLSPPSSSNMIDVASDTDGVGSNGKKIEIKDSTTDGNCDTKSRSCTFDETVLQTPHGAYSNSSFANFLLGVPVASEDSLLSATVTGWEICSEGFQKPHTKFKISVSCKSSAITYDCHSSITVNHASSSSSAVRADNNVDRTDTGDISLSERITCQDHVNIFGVQSSEEATLVENIASDSRQDSEYLVQMTSDGEIQTVAAPDTDTLKATSASIAAPTSAFIVPKKTSNSTKKNKGKKGGAKAVAVPVPVPVPVPVNISSALQPSFSSSVYSSSSSSSSSSPLSPFTPIILPPNFPPPLPLPLTPSSNSVEQYTSSLNGSMARSTVGLHVTERGNLLEHSPGGGRIHTSTNNGVDKNSLNGDAAATESYGAKKGVTKGLNSDGGEIPDLDLESQRRYSDFEVLVSVLQKLYRGVILPPLPPKTWTSQLQQQTQPSQLFAIQRLSELQLFITSLLRHPVMKHSYELRMFLATSRVGLNSFRLTFPLFSFDSKGCVVPISRAKSIVRSSSEFISGQQHCSQIFATFLCCIY